MSLFLAQPMEEEVIPATTTWYLPAALDPAYCAAAYAFKGAANIGASYVNLVTPGTGDCTAPEVAPTWDSTNGLKFDHTAGQYISTNVVSAGNWTFAIRFSESNGGGTTAGNHFFFGSHDHNLRNTYLGDGALINKIYADYGPDFDNEITRITSGVIVFNANAIYVNGVWTAPMIYSYTETLPPENVPIFLAVLDYHGYTADPPFPASNPSFMSYYCQAFAMYNVNLGARYATALSTAMAAL